MILYRRRSHRTLSLVSKLRQVASSFECIQLLPRSGERCFIHYERTPVGVASQFRIDPANPDSYDFPECCDSHWDEESSMLEMITVIDCAEELHRHVRTGFGTWKLTSSQDLTLHTSERDLIMAITAINSHTSNRALDRGAGRRTSDAAFQRELEAEALFSDFVRDNLIEVQ